MTITNCFYCKEPLSNNTPLCPHCGSSQTVSQILSLNNFRHVNTKEGNSARQQDIIDANGIIHNVNAEDWGGCEGYKTGLYSGTLAEVTCPDCLRGHIICLYGLHEERVTIPIREFLLSIGEDGEFCSESEIARLIRIATKHKDDFIVDIFERNPWKVKEGKLYSNVEKVS